MDNTDTNNYKFLGSVYSWKDDPEEFKECFKQKHIMKVEELGSCYYMYLCDKCKIYYTVDSSD